MSKKKTHEEYVQELVVKNPTVEVIEQYVNTNTPILHHCLVHDMFWKTTPARALRGVGCEKCKMEKFRETRCKTHEQYVKEVADINPDIIVVGKYINARTPIKHYCKKHNILWNPYPDSILRGVGCKECGNEKTRDKNIKSHDKYVKDLHIANPNIEVIEEYRGANIAILHRCKIDGYIWMARPVNTLFGKGCPQCNETKGERRIRKWLEDCNMEFVYQKTFNDCKDLRALPFDFFVPKYNLCIEYDGEQHFKPIDFDGNGPELTLQQFAKTTYHDEIKNQYCRNNNIKLLRIPYFENVEDELEKFFIHLI